MQYRNARFSVPTVLSLLVAPAIPSPAQAAPETDMVITGTRVPLPARELGSPVSVIDRSDIERRGDLILSDLLRDVPGVAVSRSGPPGGLTQVRMRGAEGNHTLVLIDGVPANDPANNNEFDFAHLTTAGIERIEVLRGPAGAIYGSEAMGGVINIITRDGQKGWRGHAKGEAGSFGTFYGEAGLSGGTDRVTGALDASWLDTDGINASRFGDESDGYENRTLNAKGRAGIGPLELTASARYVDSKSETDPQNFTPGTPGYGRVVDAPGQWSDNNQFFGRTEARLNLMNGAWSHAASVSLADTERDNYENASFANRIESRRWQARYQSSFSFETGPAAHRLTGALDYEKERFANRPTDPTAPQNQERTNEETGLAGEYHLAFAERLFLTAGLRHDAHDLFRDATTYRLDAAYALAATNTRLHASYATGVTNPGFFELFGFQPGSFTGNPNLKPEETESFDIGIEQRFLDDRLRVNATYFTADLTDEIVTVFDSATFTSTAENLDGESHREGVELSASAALSNRTRLRAAYTYTDSTDPAGRDELRRPAHVASVNLNTRLLNDRLRLNIGADYTGKQADTDFATNEQVMLDDFLVVDATLRYAVLPKLDLTGRVENLFDASYEEVLSYRSPGLGAFAGVSYDF